MQVYSLFEDNETAYIVMEFLQGKTLAQLVEERGALPEKEAVGYIEKAADALAEVHRAKLLHRDVKPENVMVCDDGRVVLIDFGLSKKVEEAVGLGTRQLSTTTRFGSDGYAPPEQYLKSGVLGTHTDVYALGATLYFLLTGEAPPSAMERASGITIVSPRSGNPAISRITNSAVMKAMKLKQEDRLQTVEEFAVLLTTQSQAAAKQVAVTAALIPTKVAQNITSVPILPKSLQANANASTQSVELIIKSVSGTTNIYKNRGTAEAFDYPPLHNATIRDKYVSTTLNRVLVNVPLKNSDTKRTKRFTVLEMAFHYLWRYRMETYHSVKLIDPDGFQYGREYMRPYDFDQVILPYAKPIATPFDAPEGEIEDGAKIKGWIWFKSLPDGVLPHRIVVSRYLFEPGHTSGSINEQEVQEFKIEDFILSEIKHLDSEEADI